MATKFATLTLSVNTTREFMVDLKEAEKYLRAHWVDEGAPKKMHLWVATLSCLQTFLASSLKGVK